MGMQLEFAAATDPGLDPNKRVNEDSSGQLDSPIGRLFVVCDGMGGHLGGKQASELAVSTILARVGAAAVDADPARTLVGAIEEAARLVFELGGPGHNPQRPGSTCVAALLKDGHLELAHVGDSRAYMVRGKQIHRITRDHSYVQELVDRGQLSEREAISHPDANKITRALGMTPTVQVELRSEPIEVFDGDFFLLATDGLTDLARDDDILVTTVKLTKSAGVQAACSELVALANRRGGHDNITVQIVRVLQAGPKASRTRVEAPAGARPPAAATVVQAPPGHTDPGANAAPTIVDGHYATHPGPSAHAPAPFGHSGGAPPPMPSVPSSESNPLVKVVIGMALAIGLLLAALIWSLFGR